MGDVNAAEQLYIEAEDELTAKEMRTTPGRIAKR